MINTKAVGKALEKEASNPSNSQPARAEKRKENN